MTKAPVARLRGERGIATAEYAAVTAAGCGFAGLLIKFLTSEKGQRILEWLIEYALKVFGLAL